MEFNVLPKSKFLSLSPRNNHRSNQTTNQTVNVILPRESKIEHDGEISEKSSVEIKPKVSDGVQNLPTSFEAKNGVIDDGSIHYTNREVKLDENEVLSNAKPAEQLSNEDSISTINFLKLVLESYMNNPIKYNGFVICSVPTLEHLIEVLTGCEDCSIDIGDAELGCCGSNKQRIVPISKIWVRNGDVSEVFKYRYSPYLQTFEEYRISLKFVYVE